LAKLVKQLSKRRGLHQPDSDVSHGFREFGSSFFWSGNNLGATPLARFIRIATSRDLPAVLAWAPTGAARTRKSLEDLPKLFDYASTFLARLDAADRSAVTGSG
jgi:hypothetical protein